ncbi:flagellar brake protein [Vibrio sp. THAF190c]|uniref:PilZ domain-containing protein n=1 Tax=Vibrio sp. THAF190c TaxID=2587865 RepID=UPI0012687086|nr:flagellar brake protein [Vibrio sp. THAF190c]QFT12037.1 Cyclic di-GMP binding protein [Vibrio sp. THAF190c]
MNAPLKRPVEPNQSLQDPRNRTVSTINSTDALAMIEHGSELTLNITTPVGSKFLATTKFIGTHSENCILIEVPEVSSDDLGFFFQEGFWMTVRAYSLRGEGALIHFRSQIHHNIGEPFPLLILSTPSTMQVTQLRKETRYEVNLAGKININDQRTDCEIRDLSKSGCRFVTSPTSRNLQVAERVSIEISPDNYNGPLLPPLKGVICNLQKSTHYARYGVEFDEVGRANARNLLSKLKFDGTKLRLRQG